MLDHRFSVGTVPTVHCGKGRQHEKCLRSVLPITSSLNLYTVFDLLWFRWFEIGGSAKVLPHWDLKGSSKPWHANMGKACVTNINLKLCQSDGLAASLRAFQKHLSYYLHLCFSSCCVSKCHLCASEIVLAYHPFSKPTFDAAAARLQHPGVHVSLGVGEELVSS